MPENCKKPSTTCQCQRFTLADGRGRSFLETVGLLLRSRSCCPYVLTAVMATHCSKYLMVPNTGEFAIEAWICPAQFRMREQFPEPRQTDGPERKNDICPEFQAVDGDMEFNWRAAAGEGYAVKQAKWHQWIIGDIGGRINQAISWPSPAYPFLFVRNKKLNKTHEGLCSTRTQLARHVHVWVERNKRMKYRWKTEQNTTQHIRRPSKVSKFEGARKFALSLGWPWLTTGQRRQEWLRLPVLWPSHCLQRPRTFFRHSPASIC